jgi:hypothetical protein
MPVSITTAAESGNGSLVKNFNVCGCPFSSTEKFLGSSPPTSLPSLSFTLTGTSTRFTVFLMVKPTSSPVSISLGTLPAGTVVTGGIGGGAGFASVESGALRGSSFDPVVTPAPELSAGGALGCVSSSLLAPGRGLGSSGGGIGRVADGASGMSSGFCCAARAPASNPTNNNDSPSLSSALVFVTIPGILCLSFFFEHFLLIQMPSRAPLAHLTVTASYRID